VNASFAAAAPSGPVLAARAAAELEQIAAVTDLATRVAVVPWLAEEPRGAERLRQIIRQQAER